MPSYWRVVNKVIYDADILLLLLDARMVEGTRNKEVENKVRDKPLIYVITKSDLVDKNNLEKYKKIMKKSVFVSSKLHYGTTILRNKILIEAKRAKIDFSTIRVGVLGYPNVGKSSLINAMKGRKSASTSKLSGHTKGVQNIRADSRIMFLDTPGVIPYMEKNALKLASIGSVDYTKVKDPDIMVMDLMKEYPQIEQFFNIKNEDKELSLEQIAKKKNMLKRKGESDLVRAARMILKDWQTGKIV